MPAPTPHRARSTPLGVLAGAVIGACCLAVGCAETPDGPRTADDVRNDIARRVVSGLDIGLDATLTAERVDPETGHLLGVRFDQGSDRLAFADRAEIILDADRDTLQLRLTGVITAGVGADEAPGAVRTTPAVLTDAVPLGYDLVP